ncbi:MAG TPA: SRPBCC family protein [Bacteroidales bacterium]|nr:SRPBCC family protein [Bacteroidales bacterium]HRZ76392.1 SRPBCC family protein [Bacteroidales bacterium]
MELHSDTLEVKAPAKQLYAFLTDFNHFSALLPDQVREWSADTTQCSFVIEGLPRISLRLGDTDPGQVVTYLPGDETPVEFKLIFRFMDRPEESGCTMNNTLEAEVSPMIAMMARRPLQNFLDLVSTRLRDHMETQNA